MTEAFIMGTVAEWLAVAVALITGIIALILASKSNSTSATNVLTSKSALSEAKRSNRTAAEANRIASEAAAEAKRSTDIAERVEARQTERNSVIWELPKRPTTGKWRATNTGVDTAFEAFAVLDIDGKRIVSESTDVPGGAEIMIDTSEIYKAKAARNLAAKQRANSRGVSYFASSTLTVRHYISWRTANGVWHTSAVESP